MRNISADDRLVELRRLLYDYSFPERKYEGMVHDIDRLISWAIHEFVRIGLTDEDVRSYLGDPFVEVSPANGVSGWLYPCESPDGKSLSTDIEGSWFYEFEFKDHVLCTIQKKKWRLIK